MWYNICIESENLPIFLPIVITMLNCYMSVKIWI